MKQGGIFWTRDFFSLVHRCVLELIVELTSFMAVPEHSQMFFLSFCPYTASLVLLSITGKIPWQYFLPTDPCHRYYRCWCSVTSVVSDSLWPHRWQPTRLLCPLDSPGKNTGVGCHALLQGIFLTQGSNLHLLLGRQILYHWVTREVCQSVYTYL